MKRFERGADLLLWLAISAVVVIARPPDVPWHPEVLPFPWLKVAGVAMLGLAAAVGRRHPAAAAAVPVALGFTATPELSTEAFMVAQVALAFLLGRRSAATRTGVLFVGAVCATGLLLAALTPAATLSSWLAMLTNALLTILLPYLAGRYVRQHDELVRAGWQLAERLEREQDLIGERTRLLERSRIAGDMHDSLGHELSLIALRASALQVDPGLDEPARSEAGELRSAAARAIGRLHEVIEVLREDGAPAPVLPSGDGVAELVDRARAAGLDVSLEGELAPLPPMADRAAYRVVQEALTNATKHAPGAAVTVRLGVDAPSGDAVVSVANAASPAGRGSGHGSGLVGLDERVRLAGGRLDAGRVDGRFEVSARLPLTAGAAATPRDSQRELALARRKVRRSMIDAIWVPVAAFAALLLLTLGHDAFSSDLGERNAEAYEQLRPGQSRASVSARLEAGLARPDGAPADPPGATECRFYRARPRSESPAYRLCFKDGRLWRKDELPLAQ